MFAEVIGYVADISSDFLVYLDCYRQAVANGHVQNEPTWALFDLC